MLKGLEGGGGVLEELREDRPLSYSVVPGRLLERITESRLCFPGPLPASSARKGEPDLSTENFR